MDASVAAGPALIVTPHDPGTDLHIEEIAAIIAVQFPVDHHLLWRAAGPVGQSIVDPDGGFGLGRGQDRSFDASAYGRGQVKSRAEGDRNAQARSRGSGNELVQLNTSRRKDDIGLFRRFFPPGLTGQAPGSFKFAISVFRYLLRLQASLAPDRT